MDKPQLVCLSEESVNYSVYDAKWIPCSAKIVVLGLKPRGTGILQIYEMTKGKLVLQHEVEKPKGFKCCTFGASLLRERNLASGNFEGMLEVWDLENTQSPVHSYQGHKDLINCIDGVGGSSVGCGAPEIGTGGRDGTINVWDTRVKDKPVASIKTTEGDQARDCWCIAFGNSYNSEERTLAAGYDNGDLKLFDLKAMKVLYETNLGNGVCGVEFDRKDIPMNKLVATTLESKFHLFDLRTYNPKKGYTKLTEKANKATVWSVRHLPQNRDIWATTGGDGTICLWKYNYPPKREIEGCGVIGHTELLQNILLTTQPVSTLDWSPDKLGLGVATSFDQTLRLFITTNLNLF